MGITFCKIMSVKTHRIIFILLVVLSNSGLELMGHMTRICELPCDDFKFKYYIHDPWWVNIPWYDRYDGNPHDIYMPMA